MTIILHHSSLNVVSLETHTNLLQECEGPEITKILENNAKFLENPITFQKDGAHLLFDVRIRYSIFEEPFPKRWLSKGSSGCPARSP